MLGHGLLLLAVLALPALSLHHGTAKAAAEPPVARDALILKPQAPVTTAHHDPMVYTVRSGDVLGSIAQRFNVAMADIVAYNQLTDPDKLQVGARLVLPDGAVASAAPLPATPKPRVTKPAAPAPARILGRPGRFPYGYCTYWVAIHRYIPWLGNANQWFGAAVSLGWATGQTPQLGAIMVTRESGWGHVALVEAVYPDGSWDVNEMNYRGWGIVSHRHIRPGGVPLIGFIY